MSWGVYYNGLLSPLLFVVYVDDILQRLAINNRVCSLVGCVYADDLLHVLIASALWVIKEKKT